MIRTGKMRPISSILEEATEQKNNLVSEIKTDRPFFPDLSWPDYKALFKSVGTNILLSRKSTERSFRLFPQNNYIIKQMYYYTVGDAANFDGNLYNGNLVYGPVGVGKTVTLFTAWQIFHLLNNKTQDWCDQTYVNCREIDKPILVYGYNYFKKRKLFFDDLGREPQVINDYGNKSKPLFEIWERRYIAGTRVGTWGTSQYPIKKNPNYEHSFLEKYHEYLASRMNEIMNVFEMTGKNLR